MGDQLAMSSALARINVESIRFGETATDADAPDATLVPDTVNRIEDPRDQVSRET